ncbi:MAG TPA: flagellar basal body rod C-terminal domain-containing protein [Candidatus Cybelea sp.]|nr:flagellar basal body rod C-terminal domain-containing protein [Candidatus Cybelea sp.]
MIAARTRLEIATENLANVSTDGFRRIDARGFMTSLGVAIARSRHGESGPLRHTGRDLDLAIIGGGAFRVADARGRVSETRAGGFIRGTDGTLRDAGGRVVLGLHGTLRVPAGAALDAREFGLPAGSRLRSGFLEAPAVDAISEMIDVLAAERSFESAEKAVAAIDAVRQRSADAARVK